MITKHGSAVQAEAEPTQADVWGEIERISQLNAESTDTIRKAMIAIAEKIGEVASIAGIYHGATEPKDSFSPDDEGIWWRKDFGNVDGPRWYRLAVRKISGEWKLVIEYTDCYPSHWDGSNWVGHDDPFEECDEWDMSTAPREHLLAATERLPAFLRDYLAELKRRHARYTHVKALSETIEAGVQ